MRTILCTILAMVSISALAYDAVFFSFDLATGTTNSQAVAGVSGKVVKYIATQASATGATNAISIVTTASTGATIGAARTVVASTNVTTTAAEGEPNVYLYNDTVVMQAIHTGTNTASQAIKGVLILEKP
jgi:hypothetical protein